MSRAEDTTAEEFRRVIDVNLMGQVHGLMAALTHLRARGRVSFISISSVEVPRAFPYHGATPLPAGAPDNLFAPLPHRGRVEGPFAQGSRSRSLYTLLRTLVPHRRTLAMAGGGPPWRDTSEPAGSPAPQVSR